MFKVEFIGNLGADAELRKNDQGEFVTMSLYHDEQWIDRSTGQLIRETVRAGVTVRGNMGNLLPYLKKGFKAFVRGNASLRIYTGNDKLQHIGLDIRATEFEPLFEKKLDTPQQEEVQPL